MRFKQFGLICILLLLGSNVIAQEEKRGKCVEKYDYKKFQPINSGLEIQVYPAGIMPGIVSDWYLKDHFALNTRLGLNMANRHDWSGFHDSEKGTGYGGSIGLRYYVHPECDGLLFGVRSDLWKMRINWEKHDVTPIEKGHTDILILQPTAEIGYLWRLKESKWNIGAILALGFEINIKTEGEEVGQGRVSLFGAMLTRTF